MAFTVLKTNTSGLDTQFQFFMDKKLLTAQKELIVMDQPATKKPLPRNSGATSIRFHRPPKGNRANTQVLVEGVPPTTSSAFAYTKVDFSLESFGDVKVLSDLLQQTDLFDTLTNASKTMGYDAAYHADFHITEKIVPGIAAGSKHYAGGAANFAALVALTNDQGKLVIDDLNRALSFLTIETAPKLGGEYVAIMPPQLSYNLRKDENFLVAGQYGTSKGLMNGEIGRWYGIRILETTQPWREAGVEDTYSGAGTIFTAICTGSEGYGCPILSGSSPWSPSMIVNNKPDKSDPLGQLTTVGYKFWYTAGRLMDPWIQLVRAKSTLA